MKQHFRNLLQHVGSSGGDGKEQAPGVQRLNAIDDPHSVSFDRLVELSQMHGHPEPHKPQSPLATAHGGPPAMSHLCHATITSSEATPVYQLRGIKLLKEQYAAELQREQESATQVVPAEHRRPHTSTDIERRSSNIAGLVHWTLIELLHTNQSQFSWEKSLEIVEGHVKKHLLHHANGDEDTQQEGEKNEERRSPTTAGEGGVDPVSLQVLVALAATHTVKQNSCASSCYRHQSVMTSLMHRDFLSPAHVSSASSSAPQRQQGATTHWSLLLHLAHVALSHSQCAIDAPSAVGCTCGKCLDCVTADSLEYLRCIQRVLDATAPSPNDKCNNDNNSNSDRSALLVDSARCLLQLEWCVVCDRVLQRGRHYNKETSWLMSARGLCRRTLDELRCEFTAAMRGRLPEALQALPRVIQALFRGADSSGVSRNTSISSNTNVGEGASEIVADAIWGLLRRLCVPLVSAVYRIAVAHAASNPEKDAEASDEAEVPAAARQLVQQARRALMAALPGSTSCSYSSATGNTEHCNVAVDLWCGVVDVELRVADGDFAGAKELGDRLFGKVQPLLRQQSTGGRKNRVSFIDEHDAMVLLCMLVQADYALGLFDDALDRAFLCLAMASKHKKDRACFEECHITQTLYLHCASMIWKAFLLTNRPVASASWFYEQVAVTKRSGDSNRASVDGSAALQRMLGSIFIERGLLALSHINAQQQERQQQQQHARRSARPARSGAGEGGGNSNEGGGGAASGDHSFASLINEPISMFRAAISLTSDNVTAAEAEGSVLCHMIVADAYTMAASHEPNLLTSKRLMQQAIDAAFKARALTQDRSNNSGGSAQEKLADLLVAQCQLACQQNKKAAMICFPVYNATKPDGDAADEEEEDEEAVEGRKSDDSSARMLDRVIPRKLVHVVALCTLTESLIEISVEDAQTYAAELAKACNEAMEDVNKQQQEGQAPSRRRVYKTPVHAMLWKRLFAANETIHGLIKIKTKRWVEALQHFSVALSVLDELGDKEGVAALYGKLGTTYRMMNEVERCLKYTQQMHELAEELQSEALVYRAKIAMADIHARLQNFKQAMSLWGTILHLSRSYEDRAMERKVAKCLIHTYESQNAYADVVRMAQALDKLALTSIQATTPSSPPKDAAPFSPTARERRLSPQRMSIAAKKRDLTPSVVAVSHKMKGRQVSTIDGEAITSIGAVEDRIESQKAIAAAYAKLGMYQKCLDAIDEYEQLVQGSRHHHHHAPTAAGAAAATAGAAAGSTGTGASGASGSPATVASSSHLSVEEKFAVVFELRALAFAAMGEKDKCVDALFRWQQCAELERAWHDVAKASHALCVQYASMCHDFNTSGAATTNNNPPGVWDELLDNIESAVSFCAQTLLHAAQIASVSPRDVFRSSHDEGSAELASAGGGAVPAAALHVYTVASLVELRALVRSARNWAVQCLLKKAELPPDQWDAFAGSGYDSASSGGSGSFGGEQHHQAHQRHFARGTRRVGSGEFMPDEDNHDNDDDDEDAEAGPLDVDDVFPGVGAIGRKGEIAAGDFAPSPSHANYENYENISDADALLTTAAGARYSREHPLVGALRVLHECGEVDRLLAQRCYELRQLELVPENVTPAQASAMDSGGGGGTEEKPSVAGGDGSGLNSSSDAQDDWAAREFSVTPEAALELLEHAHREATFVLFVETPDDATAFDVLARVGGASPSLPASGAFGRPGSGGSNSGGGGNAVATGSATTQQQQRGGGSNTAAGSADRKYTIVVKIAGLPFFIRHATHKPFQHSDGNTTKGGEYFVYLRHVYDTFLDPVQCVLQRYGASLEAQSDLVFVADPSLQHVPFGCALNSKRKCVLQATRCTLSPSLPHFVTNSAPETDRLGAAPRASCRVSVYTVSDDVALLRTLCEDERNEIAAMRIRTSITRREYRAIFWEDASPTAGAATQASSPSSSEGKAAPTILVILGHPKASPSHFLQQQQPQQVPPHPHAPQSPPRPPNDSPSSSPGGRAASAVAASAATTTAQQQQQQQAQQSAAAAVTGNKLPATLCAASHCVMDGVVAYADVAATWRAPPGLELLVVTVDREATTPGGLGTDELAHTFCHVNGVKRVLRIEVVGGFVSTQHEEILHDYLQMVFHLNRTGLRRHMFAVALQVAVANAIQRRVVPSVWGAFTLVGVP